MILGFLHDWVLWLSSSIEAVRNRASGKTHVTNSVSRRLLRTSLAVAGTTGPGTTTMILSQGGADLFAAEDRVEALVDQAFHHHELDSPADQGLARGLAGAGHQHGPAIRRARRPDRSSAANRCRPAASAAARRCGSPLLLWHRCSTGRPRRDADSRARLPAWPRRRRDDPRPD